MEGWKGTLLVHLALLTVQLIFSGNQIASKLGMNSFHPSVFLFFRCIMVVPIMIVAAKLKEKQLLPKTRREWILVIAMSVFSFFSFEVYIFGMKVTSVTTGTTLQATTPLWTLLIALALKMEGPSVMKIVGVIFAILGAVVSIAGNHIYKQRFGPETGHTDTNSDFPGGLLLIVNAMAFSGYVTLQKYVLKTMQPLTTQAWNVTICAVLTFFVAIFFMDTVHLQEIPTNGWISLLYAAFMSMAIAYSLLSWAAKQTSTTVVSVYSTVMPVISPIMGFFMLNESITIIQVLGMVVTISGVFFVIRARFIEEKKNKLTAAGKEGSYVAVPNGKGGLLDPEKENDMEEDDRVGITFLLDEEQGVWVHADNDEDMKDIELDTLETHKPNKNENRNANESGEIEEEDLHGQEIGRSSTTKGSYNAIVSSDFRDVELHEVVASA